MSDATATNISPNNLQSAGKTQKAKTLPDLRTDLVLQEAPRDLDGSPNWILHDPIAGRYIKLGWQEHEIFKRWHFRTTEKIAQAVSRETALGANAEQVENFASLLLRFGMLRADWRTIAGLSEARKSIVGRNKTAIATSRVLFPKIPLFRPHRFLDASYPIVAPLLTKPFAVFVVFVFLLALFLVSRQWSEFTSTFSYLFTLEGVVVSVFALVLSKVIHELAHAYVSRKYGVRVPSMGIAFLVFFPVLFTETSEAWMIPQRKARIAIAAAGMAAEMVIAVFALLAWSMLDDGPLRSACFVLASTVWIMSLLVNLNPLIRFDGYFILSEALGVENLSTRATALGRHTLEKIWTGHPGSDPEVQTSRRGRFWLRNYFVAMVVYRLFLYAAIAGSLFYLFPKAVALPGIALILVNFVAKPIFTEWHNARSLSKEHGQGKFWFRTFVFLAIILGVLFIPFRSTFTGSAIVSPGETLDIFAPEAAQIVQLDVQNGDQVTADTVIGKMDIPELASLIARTSTRVRSLETFLQRQITNEVYRESQEVQLEQLLQARAERDGYIQRKSALTLQAGSNGVITNILSDARPGRWVDNVAPLATIISDGGYRIEAYFDEGEIGRLEIGSSGILMIDGLPDLEFEVVLTQIAPTGQDVLTNPLLSSIHGGPIPVRQDDAGRLIPERGIYLTRFQAVNENPFIQLPNRELRGSVRLKADASSIAAKFYRKITSIMLRETGFQLPGIAIP